MGGESNRHCYVDGPAGVSEGRAMKRIRRAKPFARPPAAFAGLSFRPDVVLKLVRWNLRYWLLDMDMKGIRTDRAAVWRTLLAS